MSSDTSQTQCRKLRSACNSCHFGKLRCSGGSPCTNCQVSSHECVYSLSNRLGRPKGVKNKRHGNESSRGVRGGSKESVSSIPTSAATIDLPSMAMDDPGFDFNEDAFLNSLIDFTPSNEYMSPPSSLIDNPFLNPLPTTTSTPLLNPFDTQLHSYTHTQSSHLPTSTCNCVHQHADLLFYLKNLQKRQRQPDPHSTGLLPIDTLLTAAQQTLTVWNQFITCHTCQQEENEEALLLSAMCLRAVLRLLQDFSVDEFDLALTNTITSSPENISKRARLSTPTPPATGTTTPTHMNTPWITPSSSSTTSTDEMLTASSMMIGDYHIQGEERSMVGDMLALHTLGRIKSAVSCLQERSAMYMHKSASTSTSTSAAGSISGSGSGSGSEDDDLPRDIDILGGDLEYVRRILHGLDNVVHGLGKTLQCKHRLAMVKMYEVL